MLQIAVCDRSAEHADRLEALIRQIHAVPIAGIEQYRTAGDFFDRLRQPHDLDVLFLDTTCDLENAFRAARAFQRCFPAGQIIFSSCHVAHAIEISDVSHAYFLVKPYDPLRVHAALAKAQELREATGERRVLIPMRGGADIVLPIAQIVCFERVRRTTVVNCVDANYETAMKLSALEELLPARQFARPHNSYLVNLAYAKKIERFRLHLSNGEVLPISNQRRALFREALATYLR